MYSYRGHLCVCVGLLKILADFIFAVVCSSVKTTEVCTVQKFPAIRYYHCIIAL